MENLIMPHIKQRILPYAMVSLLALGALSGCATQPGAGSQAGATPSVQSAEKQHYFLVRHESGRIFAFGDVKNYLLFMAHGEVPLTRTRIGAGPNGETVVFGITKAESKALDKPTAAEKFFDGNVGEASHFYGEAFSGGRYHVFGEWQDFKDYLSHKEITFTFTEIGTGPNGETVIYALNKKTKDQGRPMALIEAFKALRQTK
jgi:hypothetical protein